MVISGTNPIIDRLLDLCNQPYLKAAVALAKAAEIFIQGDSVQVAVRTVADSKWASIQKAIKEMPQKKDVRSAAEGILVHLMEAYYLFDSYYQKMPKRMKVQIPGLWEFNEFHMSTRGVAEVEDIIARICFLKALFHTALGDDPSLVKEWLCEKEFPCDQYNILTGLLGHEAAMEYMASHPEIGRYIAGQYLMERGVSLKDYQAEQNGSDSVDRIFYSEEDPIIYLD